MGYLKDIKDKITIKNADKYACGRQSSRCEKENEPYKMYR